MCLERGKPEGLFLSMPTVSHKQVSLTIPNISKIIQNEQHYFKVMIDYVILLRVQGLFQIGCKMIPKMACNIIASNGVIRVISFQ